MPFAYRSISEYVCQLIPILYSLSPKFVSANHFHTIELGLVVSAVLFTNCVHLMLVKS